MAKLKARGRREIYRLSRERLTPSDKDVIRTKDWKALMTDGNILKRHVIYWNPAVNMGPFHDYGWKVSGKIKPGLTPETALKISLDAGWKLEDLSPAHFDQSGNTITGRSTAPLRTEAKAASQSRATTKRALQSKDQYAAQNGPGFYVVNNYVNVRSNKPRIADHEKPYSSFETAEGSAINRLRNFRDMGFDYLLPVTVVEATSRLEAEMGGGHTWWIDGKFRGPAIDPRQEGFGF